MFAVLRSSKLFFFCLPLLLIHSEWSPLVQKNRKRGQRKYRGVCRQEGLDIVESQSFFLQVDSLQR